MVVGDCSGMFREAHNFSYQRNWLQAVGWYMIFVLIGFPLIIIVGRIAGIGATSFAEGFKRGIVVGQIAGIIYIILIAVLLLWRRPKGALNILLVIAGVALDALVGAFVGLIPLAVLTTRPPLQKSQSGELTLNADPPA
jgi:ABC-type Fe3+-siderophore transport system permease subunit